MIVLPPTSSRLQTMAERMASARARTVVPVDTAPAPGVISSRIAPFGKAATVVPLARASIIVSPNGSAQSGEATKTEPDA